MPEKLRITDPFGILQELNPDASQMVDAEPDIEANLSRIADRVEKANYLEPYFFHPDEAVQARAASACVPVDVGKLGDYLTNVLATAKDPATLNAAAAAVWKREESGTGGVAYTIDSLRAYLHLLGRANVRRIVDILLRLAPNAEARTKFYNEASSRGENLFQLLEDNFSILQRLEDLRTKLSMGGSQNPTVTECFTLLARLEPHCRTKDALSSLAEANKALTNLVKPNHERHPWEKSPVLMREAYEESLTRLRNEFQASGS